MGCLAPSLFAYLLFYDHNDPRMTSFVFVFIFVIVKTRRLLFGFIPSGIQGQISSGSAANTAEVSQPSGRTI
jgi:hypothetical protein